LLFEEALRASFLKCRAEGASSNNK